MGEVIRLRSAAPPVAPTLTPEAFRRRVLVGALVSIISLALATIIYVSLPRTPSNLAVHRITPDANDDSAVFDPKAAQEEQRVRSAVQEKEDSAVFGQAPSSGAYAAAGR